MKFHEISLHEISHPDFTPRIDQTEQDPRGIDGLLGGDGGAIEGGSQVAPRAMRAGLLPAADAKILAMLTVNHYIYALKLMSLTHY